MAEGGGVAQPGGGSGSVGAISAGGAGGDDRRCGTCRARISLVESLMKCRCGLVHCEKHRPTDLHDCTFDWRAMQQQKVAKENPQVITAGSSVASSCAWCRQHEKYHPVDGVGRRRIQQFHAVGVLVLVGFAVRGVLLTVFQLRPVLLLQQLVMGWLCGFACSRVLPHFLLGVPFPSCRFCIFSWELLQNAPWCLEAEWESLKEHLIFVITAGNRNCLTRKLYDGPRSLPHIARTVSTRLKELASGQGACCS
mmetsp:Transcript_70578/g.199155  ORF Transcript_70578/g.199155 Transcript_70578/m.199155 type:complete len:252 (-) Transcript_70578:38-793(-)